MAVHPCPDILVSKKTVFLHLASFEQNVGGGRNHLVPCRSYTHAALKEDLIIASFLLGILNVARGPILYKICLFQRDPLGQDPNELSSVEILADILFRSTSTKM